MDPKLLIDSIVQQTTVLIAQLSTAAGVRAPLAHVADQVFVSLAKEIESQGVGRKVVADMFGLALRTYQRRVQRLTESATVRDKTLWEAVLEFLQGAPQNRERIGERFHYDGEERVGAVLADLVANGVVYCTGRGGNAVYGLSSTEDMAQVMEHENTDSLASMVWLRVFSAGGMTRSQLDAGLTVTAERLDSALGQLLGDGRLVVDDSGRYTAANLVLPLGAEQGWEAAVFYQFSVVAQTIAAKLRLRARAEADDNVGGTTLTLTVYDGHPYRDEVLTLLRRTRQEMDALWGKVSKHNEEHAVPEDAEQVCFYFGQNVKPLHGASCSEEEDTASGTPVEVAS